MCDARDAGGSRDRYVTRGLGRHVARRCWMTTVRWEANGKRGKSVLPSPRRDIRACTTTHLRMPEPQQFAGSMQPLLKCRSIACWRRRGGGREGEQQTDLEDDALAWRAARLPAEASFAPALFLLAFAQQQRSSNTHRAPVNQVLRPLATALRISVVCNFSSSAPATNLSPP